MCQKTITPLENSQHVLTELTVDNKQPQPQPRRLLQNHLNNNVYF